MDTATLQDAPRFMRVQIPRFADVVALEQGRRVADWVAWEAIALRELRTPGCTCEVCLSHGFLARLGEAS